MIEFITLFLGALIVGPNEVRLQVHHDVAAVEIRLDRETVSVLREEPWATQVDFGDELVPHLLEAIAYEAEGSEIGRAGQWVNLSPKESEVTIALDRDRSSDTVVARVTWESLFEENEPVRASATFDGESLEVENPRLIPLPPHDPGRLHHFSVELEFGGSHRSAAEITFGGVYGDDVSSGLTAVPVALETGRHDLPALDALQGWFRYAGRPLRVQAAEKGLAEIFVVRSPAARRILAERTRNRERRAHFPILGKDHLLRFVGTRPMVVAREQGPFVVFPRSTEVRDRVSGLLQTLGSVTLPEASSEEVRLADAVAVAGLFAYRSGRRRAVVLITTDEWIDASQFAPRQVSSYLEILGVPLFVWNCERGVKRAGPWGAAVNISTDALLGRAYRELSRALDRQRIVWLEGLHLPQRIALADGVEGVEALGRPEVRMRPD